MRAPSVRVPQDDPLLGEERSRSVRLHPLVAKSVFRGRLDTARRTADLRLAELVVQHRGEDRFGRAASGSRTFTCQIPS
jgi:hypothetical protein